uniref:Succinate dehydrogenase subunit 4 n=1 Tax=Glaucocystis nostochinearum TaxID=38271 RepID=E9P6E6_9EUKA|nr:succinate dehydrogenase subunit 4 [Glaucocystis nostochinearum]ADW83130.1 succinate dehydrogenase subunit 4 [Glaucocystis nostochinearum]
MLSTIKQILYFLEKKSGWLDWIFQRVSSLFLLPFCFYFNNLLFINHFLFFHIKLGLYSILEDYIHNETIKEILSLFIRLIIILGIKDLYLLFY